MEEVNVSVTRVSIIINVLVVSTGTPSLMEPGTVESVISTVASCAHLIRDAEINIEANPTSVEVKKLRYV